MKRTIGLTAIVAVALFLLTWDFTPYASANKEKREKASEATGSSSRADDESIFIKSSKKTGLSSDEESEAAGKGADADGEEDVCDPDLPLGFTGKVDEGELIRLREGQIALLRGFTPGRPFDTSARGRAVRHMEGQEEAMLEAAKKKFGFFAPLAFPNWVELGPNPIPNGQTQTTTTPVSGRVTAIAIDPVDPLKVYVGAAQGGVYRSLDGGTTWTAIFDSAQSLAIGALTLDAANGRLWVGTGEANGSADSFAGVGLYRIENVNTTATLVGPINPVRNYLDASSNAQSVPVFNGRSISKILIVPGDPTTLLVGNSGGVIGIGGNAPLGGTIPPAGLRGLYKITNATSAPASVVATRIAVSPNAVAGGCFDTPCTGNRNVNDMVFDLTDGSGNTLVVWLNGINVALDGGIYRSTNVLSGSPTFTQTFSTSSTTTSNGRGIFAQRPSNTTLIYVASGEPSTNGSLCNSAANPGGLRRSTDGGATWSAELPGGGGFCNGQCFYNIAIDVVPGATTAADKILLGGNVRSTNCQKLEGTSTDGAATVFANTDVGLHADSHVIRIAPSDPLTVYRGDDGGIWKSTDGGGTWTPLNNTTFRATQFQSLAVDPVDPDTTIGGTQDNGTEKLTTGPTWIRSDAGDGGYAMIDQSTPTTMYHTYFNQLNNQIGYARSLNSGTSWSFLGCSGAATTNGVACSSATTTAVNFYAPTALGPGSPNNTVYLGTDRLLRSATQGTANVTVSQAPLVSGVALSSIGISPQDDNYRIVGLNNGALFYTTTGSTTLTSLDPTGGGSVIPDFYVARLTFDPTNKNTVYLSLGGYAGNTAAASSHVWRVTNLDTTPVITSINGSAGSNVLPDVPVNGFAVDPQQPLRLFAGTDIGVFISEDGGARWSPYGTGLPRVAVFDMVIQNVKRVLRIATHGRGMWEIPLFAPTAATGTIRGQISTADGTPLGGVSIELRGGKNARAITDSLGRYSFTDLEVGNFYTVFPARAGYTFAPASRSVSLNNSEAEAGFSATADSLPSSNVIDSADYFVRQQYLDFLDREPDQGGLEYWTAQINQCHGEESCVRDKRIDVSAAFFMEQEMQLTGSFVYGLYKASLGRNPGFAEFMPDRNRISVGDALESSKQALIDDWVTRAAFKSAYPDSMSHADFVNKLFDTAGLSGDSAERQSYINALNAGGARSQVLRGVIDSAAFKTNEYKRAFVLMEYFGYLRRDPEQAGYDFWLNVLNNKEPNNFRGMVCSFITSAEYQKRFSSVVTHSNQECR